MSLCCFECHKIGSFDKLVLFSPNGEFNGGNDASDYANFYICSEHVAGMKSVKKSRFALLARKFSVDKWSTPTIDTLADGKVKFISEEDLKKKMPKCQLELSRSIYKGARRFSRQDYCNTIRILSEVLKPFPPRLKTTLDCLITKQIRGETSRPVTSLVLNQIIQRHFPNGILLTDNEGKHPDQLFEFLVATPHKKAPDAGKLYIELSHKEVPLPKWVKKA